MCLTALLDTPRPAPAYLGLRIAALVLTSLSLYNVQNKSCFIFQKLNLVVASLVKLSTVT